MATIVLVLFALFVLPFYLHTKVSTMPEFLEKRYDRRSRQAFSGFTVFTAMFIDAAADLFIGGLVLQVFFPDIPFMVLVAGMALLGGIYVIMGGLQAVTITDTLQGVLLFLVGVGIFVAAFADVGWSFGALRDLAPEGGFTLAPPADDEFMPWPGIFTGVFWLGVYYRMTNHIVVQKVLAARNIDHGRWGGCSPASCSCPCWCCSSSPGSSPGACSTTSRTPTWPGSASSSSTSPPACEPSPSPRCSPP